MQRKRRRRVNIEDTSVRLNAQQMETLAELYQEMYDKLLLYGSSALHDEHMAEEAVQETFQIACIDFNKMMESGNPQGWLVNVLRYVIQNTRRKRANLNKLVISAMSIDDAKFAEVMVSSMDLSRRVENDNIDILYGDMLPTDDMKLVKMIALQDYTFLEAAQEFHISLEACKKRMQRNKLRMQNIFEKDD